MITKHMQQAESRMEAAIAELQELIRSHYPTAVFTVGAAEDPEGIYMRALVDVDDTDEVIDVFLHRLVDLQVKDGLPLYVVPAAHLSESPRPNSGRTGSLPHSLSPPSDT